MIGFQAPQDRPERVARLEAGQDVLAELLFETQRDLESIVIRCREGDPRTDWRPIILRIAEGALARFRVEKKAGS